MASETPSKRHHRHTRSAATPSLVATTFQYPQNPHHLNSQTSVNDAESNMTIPPTTPPRTPRRNSPSVAQPKSISNQIDGGAKHKNKNKNHTRPRNVNVSPAIVKSDRRTPPLNSAGLPSSASSRPVTTPSSSAYAGPTFHASPAPSALPIPSFYSKSVPESPAARLISQKREVSQSKVSEPSNPLLPGHGGEVQREESPLDFFFKLDREEKARARSASSLQQPVNSAGPFQPPVSPRKSRTPPAPIAYPQQHSSNSNRYSGGGMFPFEMDSPSSSRIPFGPSFSTRYSERINAARASSQPSTPQDQPSQTIPQSIDRSTLLKDYLFNGHPPPNLPPLHSQPSQRSSRELYGNINNVNPIPPNHTPRNNGRLSGLRQEVTPTKTPTKTPDLIGPLNGSPTPSRQYRNNLPNSQNSPFGTPLSQKSASTSGFPDSVPANGRSADLNGLENHLRKILKLDSEGSSGATG